MTYGESVVRIRSAPTGGVDLYGMPVTSESEVDIDGAAFDPGDSEEDRTPDRDPVHTNPKLYFLRIAPDIVRTDRIRVRGVEYDVSSTPATWVDPWTGILSGMVVELTRTGG